MDTQGHGQAAGTRHGSEPPRRSREPEPRSPGPEPDLPDPADAELYAVLGED